MVNYIYFFYNKYDINIVIVMFVIVIALIIVCLVV